MSVQEKKINIMECGKEMRIKECKEWDKLPTEIREILLENQRLINKHLLELDDDREYDIADGFQDSEIELLFSKAKEKAGVRKDANIE